MQEISRVYYSTTRLLHVPWRFLRCCYAVAWRFLECFRVVLRVVSEWLLRNYCVVARVFWVVAKMLLCSS